MKKKIIFIYSFIYSYIYFLIHLCIYLFMYLLIYFDLQMMRPWQLSTILMMGTFMDRRKCTRRELRTGAFYAWPMLYGWVYPQLMMVRTTCLKMKEVKEAPKRFTLLINRLETLDWVRSERKTYGGGSGENQ